MACFGNISREALTCALYPGRPTRYRRASQQPPPETLDWGIPAQRLDMLLNVSQSITAVLQRQLETARTRRPNI